MVQRRSKRNREEDEVGRVSKVSKAEDAENGASSSHVEPSATAASLFDRVELLLDLTNDRKPRDAVTPRDLRLLLLWSLPSCEPLVSSPEIFLLRNKSKVRHVLYLYLEGWTYDLLLGAGLPQDDELDALTEEADQDREQRLAIELIRLQRKLTPQLLKPLRSNQCWARVPTGSFSSELSQVTALQALEGNTLSGVQISPLVVPSQIPRLFESSIFWTSSDPSSSLSGQRAHPLLAMKDKADSGASMYSASPSSPAGSVGDRFQRALELRVSSPTIQTPSNEEPHSPKQEEKKEEISSENSDEKTCSPEQQKLQEENLKYWNNHSLLLEFALNLSKDPQILQALGFVLAPTKAHPRESHTNQLDLQTETKSLHINPPFSEEQWKCFPMRRKLNAENPPLPNVVAFDCEMVLVEGQESALARATLLDARTGDILMDRLVKPAKPIINYLTRFSGIDEVLLRDVTTTLEECQEELCKFVDSDTFVVGHSLENDFAAMKMIPNCYLLDSAWLFPHPSGLPCKNALRFLTRRYFNKTIQQGSHDSTEDAWCAAQIVLLKLKHGKSFGVPSRSSVLVKMAGECYPVTSTEISSNEAPKVSGFPSNCHGWGLFSLFDAPDAIQELVPLGSKSPGLGAINTISVRHDEDAVRKAAKAIKNSPVPVACSSEVVEGPDAPRYHFFWVHLSENHNPFLLHPSSIPTGDEAMSSVKEADTDIDDSAWLTAKLASYETLWREAIEAVNERVVRLIDACPDNTVVTVMCGGKTEFDRQKENAAALSDTVGTPSELGRRISSASGYRGAFFAFIKDKEAPGPLTVTVAGKNAADDANKVKLESEVPTPPFCQQQ